MEQRSGLLKRLFEWVLENRGNCESPCSFSEIYAGFNSHEGTNIKRNNLRNGVILALQRRKNIEGFTIFQEIQLNFLLNVPISAEFQIAAMSHGKFQLEDGYIKEFISNDGSFKIKTTSSTRYGSQNKKYKQHDTSQDNEDEHNTSWSNSREATQLEANSQKRRPNDENAAQNADTPNKKYKDEEVPKQEEELLVPKTEDVPIVQQIVPAPPELISANLILGQLLNLIRMLKSPSLEPLKTKINQKLNTFGWHNVEVSVEDFSMSVEHGLNLLCRKSSTEIDSESMNFAKFLNLFGFLILTIGFSDESSIVVKINKEIEESESSAAVKLISMENVEFIITSLFLTAQ